MRVLLIILAFLFGSCLGSFCSAYAWDWLNNKSFQHKRSICGQCCKELKSWQLVPIFSYLLLRGKCACCGAEIPSFHFYVELATAILSALIAARYGWQWLALCYILITAALVAASAADIKAHLLPNAATLGLLVFVPAVVALNPDLSWQDALWGYALGGGIPLLLYFLFRWIRGRECLGQGDIKLFALGGALCGWQALPALMLLAALAGILAFLALQLRRDGRDFWNTEMPFGPFICGAIILLLLLPQAGVFLYNPA